MKISQRVPFSRKPGKRGSVPRRHQPPERLADYYRPMAVAEEFAVVMTADEQKLIARGEAHDARVPAAQRGAAVMPGQRAGNEDSGITFAHASQSQIDVFQIRLERLIEAVEFFEHVAAEKAGGAGGERDGRRRLFGDSSGSIPVTSAPG